MTPGFCFGCRRLLGSVLGRHLPPHPPLSKDQAPATGFWHPTRRQQRAVDVEGAAHGQRWRLNLPTPKASLAQSSPSHPGHTTHKGNAQNMRLGGAEPPDEEHLPAWLPQKVPSITHPSTFLDAAAQPRASREFKATGSSALGGNTKETGIAKIGDLSRRSLVHTMIRAWSCHQQPPAPGTLPHCLPIYRSPCRSSSEQEGAQLWFPEPESIHGQVTLQRKPSLPQPERCCD